MKEIAAFLITSTQAAGRWPSGVIVHLFYHLLVHLLMVLHAIVADPLGHDAGWREAQALVHSVHSALVHIV